VAVVGGGWAGLAAAVAVKAAGGQATVFEASRHWGGRARSVTVPQPDGPALVLDNGQHVLIGAYSRTLALMRLVGVDPEQACLRLPLRLQYPDGHGLVLPDCAPPWNVLRGLLGARGWRLRDRLALLARATQWQLQGYRCAPHLTVAQLCAGLPQPVMDGFIDLLCLSALNTPTDQASAAVFLTVLRDALVGGPGSADLLIPRQPLGALWPEAAAQWLGQGPNAAEPRLGTRVQALHGAAPPGASTPAQPWQVNGEPFDRVVWAAYAPPPAHAQAQVQARSAWVTEAIATVYAWRDPHSPWPAVAGHAPLLALRHAEPSAPAQFVFDRSRLGGPPGLVAFVISASTGDAHTLEAAVVRQAAQQLGWSIRPIQTIVEKRATFACTPQAHRPAAMRADGLLLAGDHVQGPYPATLEGAMRSGWAAGRRAMGMAED
jgi:squalene-associated FAD-dependent desaturase